MQHITLTNLVLLAAKQETNKKACRLTKKNIKTFSGKKVTRMSQRAEEGEDRDSNGPKQKNKRRGSKMESNDSPEISDMGVTSDMLGLPFVDLVDRTPTITQHYIEYQHLYIASVHNLVDRTPTVYTARGSPHWKLTHCAAREHSNVSRCGLAVRR